MSPGVAIVTAVVNVALTAPADALAGCPGTVVGTDIDAVAVDAGDAPTTFVAVTLHVYDLPLDRLVTEIGDVPPLADRVVPPSPEVHVAVYPVTLVPPSSVGAVNDTLVAWLAGSDAVTPVGDPGTVVGTAREAEGVDARDVPTELVAVTLHVYARPFERPTTLIGDPAPLADLVVPPLLDSQVAL